MYKKSVQGWLKHLDFMILDVVCLWISFTLAFGMRHGSLNVFANSLYRDMMWSLALMDIVVIFFFDSLKNVLKRGFYHEFTATVKQTCLITLCSVFYLFTFKEANDYSRLVLTYTAALYLLLSYITRNIWKYLLRKYLGGNGRRSLLIVTVSEIVDTVIDNIKNKNYSDYIVTGVCILDDKARGRTIDGVPVVADKEDLVEYVCREWVDEVFLNIPESEPYPSELLDKFIEMGVVVHMKLAKSQNLLGKKQFVERLGTYTVLTTSINSVSRRQIVLKRMLDILGGLAGCIITGILCIFVGPAIYIQSPGPIFFKQTRVGKNGKLFQMYKFRSMYMDAEERKAELMKENRVQDGMMFKLDFDPRIIGSKKLPDGTIKKGVGNFIRDWSLDEFPQFLNVLKGDMSLVGTRPPTVDEWDKYELHHRARLATKPGLTGMWQVSGRSNITDLYNIRVSDYAMGFRKKYSIATNAKIHTGKKCVVNMDLKDFFPSITQKQVFQIFYYYGYTIDVSYLLSRLCTHEGRVPQGAPTSPYLSNIICLKLDKRLSKLAEKCEADYTRYADDITFSGGAGLKSIILRVKEIIEDEGFVVNEKKTRIQFDYQGQEVTGINVSGEKITVNKRYKKKIFQEIYYCKKYGPSNHLKHVGCDKRFYKEHMYGKAYFVHMIEPDIGKEILRQLDEIRWEE